MVRNDAAPRPPSLDRATASPTPSRVAAFDEIADRVVNHHGAAPAASVAASAVVGGALRRSLGVAGRLFPSETAEPAGVETVFDLASVTKPFVAATAARLARRGELSLDEPLGVLLPRLSGTATADAQLVHLLAHRAGLRAHIELFAPKREGGEVHLHDAERVAAESRRPECSGPRPEQGYEPVYSDMGYLLVGLALEARSGLPLDELVHREVLAPLGLEGLIGSARQLRRSMKDFDERVAPTEVQDFRGGVVRGVVHDENAWSLFDDAAAGHAGLFGVAEGVLSFGEALLRSLEGDDAWLGPNELEPLVRVRPGGSLRAGFDGKSGPTPSCGSRLGDRTVGHLGFTGTSLWIDPDQSFTGVLLTNRVHPTRDHLAIRAARPDAYDRMFDAVAGRSTGGSLPR
jgi:serine-type D-Ala-D-Ala carboxypeptidase